MKIKEFQELSKRTMQMDYKKDIILNCALGLGGEAGEVQDIIEKYVFHNHNLSKQHLREEIGDVMFYIANLCNVLEIDLEEVLQGNVDKLNKRFPNGFNVADSKARVDIKKKGKWNNG